ncbi:MAG: flavodoxin family protein [Halanaerobiaceae bacterium]
MKILGIIGSPRKKKGLTYQVVTKALKGAETKGADTEITYLLDYNPDYCIHCGYDCFNELRCQQEDKLNRLFKKVENSDGIILGSPVYIWQANALTGIFMEKLRLKTLPWDHSNDNLRSALGIAVAGGTGTGVFPALKSIYSFFNLWKFNPLTPLPVTRFNFDKALNLAEKQGVKMGLNKIKNISEPAEIMAVYDDLKYLDYNRKDEFHWLASQLLKNLKEDSSLSSNKVATINNIINSGNKESEKDNPEMAVSNYMEAYKKAKKIWENKKLNGGKNGE